ncbi:hypothetical protein BY996DRAFT_6418197 [Phakopsora pachyrhizi]|uniref:Expressed protein n=1 Tax=Phakopsora pachyrhizi TaxID=170000 RepID=A0AAV0AL41_PHAPC|nr:hypothetical protein BY996DRAFT_6418197 [Phakopsora pachyrhizi]CAH7668193.1 expressed protein [Phakopsora pachyrhizi]
MLATKPLLYVYALWLHQQIKPTRVCCVPTKTQSVTQEYTHPGTDTLSFPGSNGGVQQPSPDPSLPVPEVSSGSSTVRGPSGEPNGQTKSPEKPPPASTQFPSVAPTINPDATSKADSPSIILDPTTSPSSTPPNPIEVPKPIPQGSQINNPTPLVDSQKAGIISASIVLGLLFIGGIIAFIKIRKKKPIGTGENSAVEKGAIITPVFKSKTPVSEFGRRGTVQFGRGLETNHNLPEFGGWLDTKQLRSSRANQKSQKPTTTTVSAQSISLNINSSRASNFEPR